MEVRSLACIELHVINSLVLRTLVHLKLGSRQVYISDHLCAGMFHLQPRIQLQEVETSVFREEILHGACTHVAHHLGQSHSILGQRGGDSTMSFIEVITVRNQGKKLCKLTRSICSKVEGAAMVAGASSMIFWCLLWMEQSLPNRDIAFPYSSARIWTSRCLACWASCMMKIGEPGTSV